MAIRDQPWRSVEDTEAIARVKAAFHEVDGIAQDYEARANRLGASIREALACLAVADPGDYQAQEAQRILQEALR